MSKKIITGLVVTMMFGLCFGQSYTEKIGDTYFHSNGGYTEKIGDTYFDSNGGYTDKIGDTYFNSGDNITPVYILD